MKTASSIDMRPFYVRRNLPYLKIPIFYALWFGLGYVAWHSESGWVQALCYVGMGYMQMSVATILHECTHNILFQAEWKNWAFGMVGFIPLLVPYVSYRDDHLLHHRYNRTPKDTAAFTMGKRGVLDFLLFYGYIFAGVVLLVVHFAFIHPFLYLRGKKFWIHWAELFAHAIIYAGLWAWASHAGVLFRALSVFLWPLMAFGLMNSMRFLAEHYGTPWNVGQVAGTRTVISNRINTWFWNNINYHIGHHLYPGVPWYHLKDLHEKLEPEFLKAGGVVDKSYLVVFIKAFLRGPETPTQKPWVSDLSAKELSLGLFPTHAG